MSGIADPGFAPASPPQSIWRMRWHRFRAHRPAMVSLALLAALVILCFSAPLYTRVMDIDPNATNLLKRYGPTSWQHPLGTDEIGRDVLARLMLGGQVSILVGVLTTLLTTLIGIVVGVSSGFFGGRADAFLMRFTDIMIALPLVPVLIVLGAVDLTKLGLSHAAATSSAATFWRIVIIIALIEWTTIARIVRAETLSIKHRDYVAAARVSGGGAFYNIRAHILPNVTTPLIVAATLTVGRIILFESTLSFLGFGIVPPTPTWGNMLTNAQELVTSAPHLALYPGVLIFLTVIAVNFIGDGLRVAFDPRSEE